MSEPYANVVQLFWQGYGSRRIAKMLKINRKTIEHWIYPINGKKCKPWNDPNLSPSPELSYLIGVQLGDGWACHTGRQYEIGLNTIDKDFMEAYAQCLQKVARRKVFTFFYGGRRQWTARAHSKPLFAFLRNQGASWV